MDTIHFNANVPRAPKVDELMPLLLQRVDLKTWGHSNGKEKGMM